MFDMKEVFGIEQVENLYSKQWLAIKSFFLFFFFQQKNGTVCDLKVSLCHQGGGVQTGCDQSKGYE